MKHKTAAIALWMLGIGILAGTGYGEEGAAPASGKLEDVVVKGKDTLKIEREKLALDIKMDPLKVLLPTVETGRFFLEKLSRDLTVAKPINDRQLASEGTVSPWQHAIVRDPVAVFALDAGKSRVQSWEFVITDTRGSRFRVFTGREEVPASLTWNGRDDKGQFMQVGNTYSYLLYFNDRAGNRRTVIGKPFSVPAALHQEQTGLLVSLSLQALFDVKKGGSELLPPGQALLDEASDVLKEHFNSGVSLKVYAETDSLAQEQGKAVTAYLAKRLVVPAERIRVEGIRDVPENYHVDICIRNR